MMHSCRMCEIELRTPYGLYTIENEYDTSTRLGASSEQVVRDVNPDMGFRVFDKPTSES